MTLPKKAVSNQVVGLIVIIVLCILLSIAFTFMLRKRFGMLAP